MVTKRINLPKVIVRRCVAHASSSRRVIALLARSDAACEIRVSFCRKHREHHSGTSNYTSPQAGAFSISAHRCRFHLAPRAWRGAGKCKKTSRDWPTSLKMHRIEGEAPRAPAAGRRPPLPLRTRRSRRPCHSEHLQKTPRCKRNPRKRARLGVDRKKLEKMVDIALSSRHDRCGIPPKVGPPRRS